MVYDDGSQARDFLYVGDLVEGIRVAIDGDAVGAFQLGSGKPTTVNELLGLLRDATVRELDVRYEDFRAGEVRYTWCEIDKAREGLGFDPVVSLDQGIQRTWEWFLGNGIGKAR